MDEKGGMSMGVYIKGMEMPKNCEECAIKSWDTEDYVCPFSGVSTLCISRQADCPLVLVPDHGRLIDADELMKHKGNCYDAGGHLLYAVGTGSIMCAPTIIPAEENNNNR